jgi:hypothetical protein
VPANNAGWPSRANTARAITNGVAVPAGAGLREDPEPCPACVAELPRVRSGEAQRLAAGLSTADLARRAG